MPVLVVYLNVKLLQMFFCQLGCTFDRIVFLSCVNMPAVKIFFINTEGKINFVVHRYTNFEFNTFGRCTDSSPHQRHS